MDKVLDTTDMIRWFVNREEKIDDSYLYPLPEHEVIKVGKKNWILTGTGEILKSLLP